MNKIKILSLSLLLGLAMSSCEDTLSENVNPDVAHVNTPDLGLPVVLFMAEQLVYDQSEYHVYLSQCLTTMGKSQTGSYPYKQGWEFLNINRHPQWRRHYYDIGTNVVDLVENSGSSTSNYSLIGRTIRLMSTQMTTDAFGPMPLYEAQAYSDMYGNESLTPRYETQEAVYKWMFEEADALIALYEDDAVINNPENKQIDVTQDRIYAGDLNKWKGLVYAIKARLLLRNIPNVDRSHATCQKIYDTAQKAIDAWRTGDLMYGAWFGNEPRYNFDGGSAEKSCPWGPEQPSLNVGWPQGRANLLTSAVPSKFFIQDCLGVINPGNETKQGAWDGGNGYGADPRLFLLLVPQEGPTSASNDTKATMIRYLENNIGAGSTFKQANYPDLFAGAYAKNDGYNPLFTMEELYFIQAEAKYWLGEKATACQLAKEATKMNIERHLTRYLADNGGFYPGIGNAPAKVAVIDNMNKQRYERVVTAFLENQATLSTKACDQIGNKHWFFNESEYSLSDLMIQKWIAMYMQPEQWTDMRRYHYSNNRNGYGIGDAKEIVYPTLRRPYNLYSAYWVDGLTDAEKENTWIQRLNYDPQTEDIYNMNEVIRVGAYKDYKWLQKPMIWARDYGVQSSLTVEQ